MLVSFFFFLPCYLFDCYVYHDCIVTVTIIIRNSRSNSMIECRSRIRRGSSPFPYRWLYCYRSPVREEFLRMVDESEQTIANLKEKTRICRMRSE